MAVTSEQAGVGRTDRSDKNGNRNGSGEQLHS